MARRARRRHPRRDGPREPAAHAARERASRALRDSAAEDGQPRGRVGGEGEPPPGTDGVLMEVKPGYKQTQAGVIPEDWDCTTVRDLASSIRNAIVGGPFGSDLVSKDYVDAGIPVVRGQNMAGRFVSGSFAFVTHAKAASLE